MENKKCVICGKEFTPKAFNQITCSLVCGNRRRMQMEKKRLESNDYSRPVYLKCTICGKEFEKNGRAVTCSKECSKKQRLNRISAKHQNSVRPVASAELSPQENRKFMAAAEKKQKARSKCKLTLDEKSRLCKEYGIEYAQMQVIIERVNNKAQVIEELEQIRRKRFLELSERNANLW